MRRLTLAGFGLALLTVSGTAWAGGDTGLYLGASLGSAGIDVSSGGGSYDDHATAYKIFGGYNIGIVPLIDVAVEASYVNFGTAEGSVSGNKAETKITGVDGFGLVGVNLGPVSMFGKVGAIRWDGESTVLSQKTDASGTDTAYGLGLQFQLLSIGIRAEYEIFKLDSVDIGFASAGVSYTF